MENGKIDSTLTVAIEVPREVLLENESLFTGYIEEENKWELIIKYSGDLEDIKDELDVQITELSGGYATIIIPQNQIERLSGYDNIEYIEKPKLLLFSIDNAKRASCIYNTFSFGNNTDVSLSGEGVIVAIIDSGIDYSHPDFRNEDGSSRIIELWDQTIEGNPPEGYVVGSLYTREQINEALSQSNISDRYGIVPSRDISGHGTSVAGIACGNGRASRGRYRGVAYKSDILCVKIGESVGGSFPKTTRLMEALDYVSKKAGELGKPIAINMSFGNNYGSHDGNGILEEYINYIAMIGKKNICIGTGNEGVAAVHFRINLAQNRRESINSNTVLNRNINIGSNTALNRSMNTGSNTALNRNINTNSNIPSSRSLSLAASAVLNREQNINANNIREAEFIITGFQRSVNLQIWKNYSDEFDITLVSPDGTRVMIYQTVSRTVEYILGSTRVYVLYGEPSPINVRQEIYFVFSTISDYLEAGTWKIIFTPKSIKEGTVDMWLPTTQAINRGTRFLRPSVVTTLTNPSTAYRAITVAAYNGNTDTYAEFSGRGFTANNQLKPDIAAPGVDIMSAAPNGSYTSRSGTSMATPIVTGSVALLMEWGIIKGNDPYLYGEKMKAYLRKGARRIIGEEIYPNERVGWGALCVEDSL